MTTTTMLNPRRARWGTRTVAPINLIVTGKVIVVIVLAFVEVVVDITCKAAEEDGVGGAIVAGVALTLHRTSCSSP